MISVKFRVGPYQGRDCIIASELSAQFVLEHLFLNQKESEIGLALKTNFLGKDVDKELQTEAQELVALLYRMWKSCGEHGYSKVEIKAMEAETAVVGGNIHQAVDAILRRQE